MSAGNPHWCISTFVRQLRVLQLCLFFILASAVTAADTARRHTRSPINLLHNGTNYTNTRTSPDEKSTRIPWEEETPKHTDVISEMLNGTLLGGRPGILDQVSTFFDGISLKNRTVVSSHQISTCLERRQTLHFRASAIFVHYDTLELDHGHTRSVQVCKILVEEPKSNSLYITLFDQICTGENWVHFDELRPDRVVPGRPVSKMWTGCELDHSFVSRFLVSSGFLLIELHVMDRSFPYSLVLAGKAVSPEKPDLEMVLFAPKKGYVQTPGWNPDDNASYPANMDSWVHVPVPRYHHIMVSPMYVWLADACRDKIEISITNPTMPLYKDETYGCKPTDHFGQMRVYRVPPSDVVFSVHFTSDASPKPVGFRLLFSFHQVPTEINHALWNCSVPYWEDFKMHLACNADVECYRGEDEADCPEWEICPPRHEDGRVEAVYIDGRCYDLYIAHRGYQHRLQWFDGAINYFDVASPPNIVNPPVCGYLTPWLTVRVKNCYIKSGSYLCELGDEWLSDDQKKRKNRAMRKKTISLTPLLDSEIKLKSKTVLCPEGHITHAFLACDALSACWANDVTSYGTSRESWGVPSYTSCPAPLTPLPPSFACARGGQHVPYSLVCDHRRDCDDNSDESFCRHQPCAFDLHLFTCANSQQCYSASDHCNGQFDCRNQADERGCKPRTFTRYPSTSFPAVINFDEYGTLKATRLRQRLDAIRCPDTHFLCPDSGYCLPVYVYCNGVVDCPGHEDETNCSDVWCPGYYRCRASSMCLHPDHVCDGIFQCPQNDDEFLCDMDCPEHCQCHGLAIFCPTSGTDLGSTSGLLRYVDATGSGMFQLFARNPGTYLIHLGAARCNVSSLSGLDFPNLQSLDVSFNRITWVSNEHLKLLPNLRTLFLSGNPISTSFSGQRDAPSRSVTFIHKLRDLDLSHVPIAEVAVDALSGFPHLLTLNLSGCGVQRVLQGAFAGLGDLRVLDVRDCPVTEFPRDMIRHMNNLQFLYSDNYKLCCSIFLPEGFNPNRCFAPSDEVSSCQTLLRSNMYRVILSIFAILALLGNFGSLIARLCLNKTRNKSSFGVFVTHLSASDFLMGVYLAVIGLADRMYQENYVLEDKAWRRSAACKVAGVLSLLSSEVSAFIICLITLDRFLVLRFPFSDFRFGMLSSKVACAVAWSCGLMISACPLLPFASSWEFYSQTSICIPLPISHNDSPGYSYAFGVMVILNFVLFLLIAVGQACIYISVRENSMSDRDGSANVKDKTTARRLFSVVMSDFLCWFPIGLLGLLASNGTVISGEVNVGMAIFVLPLNSALNPFLYTFNMILERRRREREERLLKIVWGRCKDRQNTSTLDQ